ncbi:STAS domain protein [Dictyocaulus viviparus]|uniref:STAS domain protein n=1 Tax=Dictyocaulus viviparus TaxID=29172 RepID=A0A0D8XXC0_DICVI|nr:STAS domain protein [Dictyocaulus viviparus]
MLDRSHHVAFNRKLRGIWKIEVLKWRLSDWIHFWKSRVPITKWLPMYNWREDLRADIIGGFMLSVMSLPQGLAYGYLVGVPPIYGIITTIFGPIVYTIFGTSKHTSPGCFAIVALMVGGIVEQFAGDKTTQGASNMTHSMSICCRTNASAIPPEKAVSIATSVTLLIGLLQIFFGLLNAGLLAVWLSDHLVQGLTSGAAVHVLTSQLKSMTGIEGVPPTSEAFGLIKVESGFPSPRVPPLDRVTEMIWPATTIAIISFVIHIALAKLISRKLNYEVDANQEWFALGAMNSIACFFGCFAGGSSLGRTMMQVKFGTKSQMSTVVCCSIMAILASIIVVAMKDLFIQLVKGFCLCRESIVDFMIFLVTLVAVIVIDVNNGLIIGISFALLADSTCMGRIPGTSDFKGLGHYRSAEEIPGIKVVRFDAPLYFANAELFILSVYNACGLNPILVRSKLNERAAAESARSSESDRKHGLKSSRDMQLRVVGRRVADETSDPMPEDPVEHVVTQLTHIIIDCSSIPYVDLMGKDALAQTYADYSTIDITVLMANCKVAVRQLFETTDFYQKVPKNRMFVNVNDAVIQALKEQRARFPDQILADQGDAAQIHKAPVAHSPPQRTIISGNEDKEEKTTQISSTPSTQQGDASKLWMRPFTKPGRKPDVDKTQ